MQNPMDRPGSRLALFGWLTGAMFFFYAWVLRVGPSVMIDELMRDFGIGAAAVGSLSAFYFYGYAGLQIPIGLIIDRFGPRRPMTIAGLLCAAGCLLFAMSPLIEGVALGRFIVGGSAAFSLVGAMAVAGQWFPANRFALLSGLAMMAGMTGGVLGQAPVRFLVEQSGWRTAMLMLSVGGVLIAISSWSTVRDGRRGTGGLRDVLAGLGTVARNRQTWLIAIAGLGTTGPLLGFAGLWGVPYLVTVHGLDQAKAAAITSMLFLGWGAGAPIFGWLSDRIERRRSPFIGGMLICTAALVSIVYLPGLTPLSLTVLCFICGFGGSSQTIGFAAVREHNPPALSGTAIGLVNGMVTGAGALYQPLLGWLLDRSWDGRLVAGARIYSASGYQIAFGALVIGAVVGVICTIVLRETYCRQVEPPSTGR